MRATRRWASVYRVIAGMARLPQNTAFWGRLCNQSSGHGPLLLGVGHLSIVLSRAWPARTRGMWPSGARSAINRAIRAVCPPGERPSAEKSSGTISRVQAAAAQGCAAA